MNKQLQTIVILFCFVNLTIFAQQVATLPAYEGFDYSLGTKFIEDNQTAGIGSWGTAEPRTTDAVIVDSPNWSSVTGLLNPQGKAMAFGGSGDNPDFVFTSQSGFGGSPVQIYTSFVMTATRVDLLDATAQRLIGFGRLTGTNSLFGAGHIIVRGADFDGGGTAQGYNLGVNSSNSTSGVTWDTTVYRKDDLLSIVLYFASNNAGGDGVYARLWVNPVLTGTEPAATVLSTNARNSNVDRIQIQQSNGANTPNITLDELRVGLSWDAVTKIENTYTWNGSTDNNWGTDTNWSSNKVPTTQDNVIIPANATPIIDGSTGAKAYDLTVDASANLSITAGGSLKVIGTSTGEFTYNISVTDDLWHLISSPVTGEQYNNTWVSDNGIASGSTTATNRGIATYDNTVNNLTTGHWRYMQENDITTFNNGQGYSLKKVAIEDAAFTNTYKFTGQYNTSDVPKTITTSVSDWTLIGNPYPSYINVSEFIAANTTAIDDAFEAIYVWNATTSSYDDLTSGYIQPGQAFFLNSATASSTVNFIETMQSHQTGVTFFKETDTSKKIDLFIEVNDVKKSTSINFIENKTKGLDPGFDIGQFNGVASDLKIYSYLIENNNNIAFEKQALSPDNLDDLEVVIGVKASRDTQIAFSISALNLPKGTNVFLEDRTKNIFTDLSDENAIYTTLTTTDLNGTGRFYLHTASKALSINNNGIKNITVYQNNNLLKIKGLENNSFTVSIYNLLGKKLVSQDFNSNSKAQEVKVSQLSTGIYIVKIESDIEQFTKKIVIE